LAPESPPRWARCGSATSTATAAAGEHAGKRSHHTGIDDEGWTPLIEIREWGRPTRRRMLSRPIMDSHQKRVKSRPHNTDSVVQQCRD
jgi:hypothetical protein